MKIMKNDISKLGLLLLLVPMVASAWWNSDWASRKALSVDTSVTGADISETLSDVPVLVRLHTGNFGFFSELAENGKDLRFALDDKTPIKYSIEKIDTASEMGLVWLKLPSVRGGVNGDSLSLYYGNPKAVDASDSKGLYDVNQSLVFHFSEGETLPQDATAYGNHANESKAVISSTGLMGASAQFGSGGIKINANPSLTFNAEDGLTFSTWIKFSQPQNATLFQLKDHATQLELILQGSAVIARYANAQTSMVNVSPEKWQHLAVVATKNKLDVFVDGKSLASTAINLTPFSPSVFIGSSETGQPFNGELDEVQLAKKARSADWLKFVYRTQSPDFTVLNFGGDESNASANSPNYFLIILQSLTVDGWVVIALCGVMLVISAIVIIGKSVALNRAKKDNAAFLMQYREIDASNVDALDREETPEEQQLSNSDFLTAVVGKHDHFQSSPIYHVYHAGVHELKKTFSVGEHNFLSPEALNLVRTRLDAAVVRENQKLNKNMVLLTIAISGGPFLGLLGTVMGVMITFAVIAATGDVNINSIAPGISGALAATVAGLAVAIPALFAYNYLLTIIKDITADMHVFTDEFLAVVSKKIADRQRSDEVQYIVLTDEFVAKVSQHVIEQQRGLAL